MKIMQCPSCKKEAKLCVQITKDKNDCICEECNLSMQGAHLETIRFLQEKLTTQEEVYLKRLKDITNRVNTTYESIKQRKKELELTKEDS